MSVQKRMPRVGTRVILKTADDEEYHGRVDWTGASQFAAECTDGVRRLVLVNNGSIEFKEIGPDDPLTS